MADATDSVKTAARRQVLQRLGQAGRREQRRGQQPRRERCRRDGAGPERRRRWSSWRPPPVPGPPTGRRNGAGPRQRQSARHEEAEPLATNAALASLDNFAIYRPRFDGRVGGVDWAGDGRPGWGCAPQSTVRSANSPPKVTPVPAKNNFASRSRRPLGTAQGKRTSERRCSGAN